MQIYTLNVNGFRGLKTMREEITNQEVDKNLQDFKQIIDRILCDNENIVILQEVPYLINKDCYQKFNALFLNNYHIFKPLHLIPAKQCTMALCKKSSGWHYIDHEIICYDANYSYGNKLVELQFKQELTLLGVHLHPSDDMWKLLFRAYENRKHTFIVGDFNAYEYRGSMKDKIRQLKAFHYSPMISSNVITQLQYHSSIDNIYTVSDFNLGTDVAVEVKRLETFVTDHALCSLKFSMSKG